MLPIDPYGPGEELRCGSGTFGHALPGPRNTRGNVAGTSDHPWAHRVIPSSDSN
jgi:hypothetical protein